LVVAVGGTRALTFVSLKFVPQRCRSLATERYKNDKLGIPIVATNLLNL